MQYNPDFTHEQREALAAVIDALRETLRLSVTLNSDADTLHGLAQGIRDINQTLEPYAGRRQLEHFNARPGDDLAGVLPCSPVTGRYHPMAPPMALRLEGDTLIGEVTLSEVYEGPEGHVHGSWVAAIYDQLLALACIANGTGGPTAKLSVDYLKPTPLHRPLRFEIKLDSADDRKLFVSGSCHCEGLMVSRSEGLFIRYLGAPPA